MSENIRMGYHNRFALGKPHIVHTYGYTMKCEIVPEEAKIIRWMFRLILKGRSLPQIQDFLNRNHIPAPGGGEWAFATVGRIVRNTTYMGDIEMQKTYVDSFLTKKKRKNRGRYQTYCIRDHHAPIIDRETFRHAQYILKMKDRTRGAVQYPYYGFLKCPYCKQNMFSFQLPTRMSERGWGCLCRTICIKQKYIDRALNAPEYMELYNTMNTITFSEDLKELIVYYKTGECKRIPIAYERISETPAFSTEEADGDMCLNGEKLPNTFNMHQAFKAVLRIKEYMQNGIKMIGMEDGLPRVLTIQAINKQNRR